MCDNIQTSFPLPALWWMQTAINMYMYGARLSDSEQINCVTNSLFIEKEIII